MATAKLWLISCEMEMPHIQAKPLCVTCSVRDEHYKNHKLANWKKKGHKNIVVEEFIHVGTERINNV